MNNKKVYKVLLNLNGTKKRCDTVLYKRDLSARMIVEYKAPHIEITQAVFDQITRYNMVLKTKQEIVANWLPRYTKRNLEDFGEYILLTNFNKYVEIFAEKFNVPILGKDANMVLKVDYLVVSNGMQHYCCRMDYDTQSYSFLSDIPDYDAL